MNPALHSSKKHDWETPGEVWELVTKVAAPRGVYDPCPVGGVKEAGADGRTPWPRLDALFYVNPPYGRELPKWVDHVIRQAHVKSEIILLCPARPDTRWFHDAWHECRAMCFWKGRLTFKGAPGPAPFPSALFYWGDHPHRFGDVFDGRGIVVVS